MKLKTGVPGLDDLLGGGLSERTCTLVTGPPGSGKTSLGLQFIYHGITESHEAAILVTFEQFPETIYRDAHNYGWDLKRCEEAGKLKVVFTSPAVFKGELEREHGTLDKIVGETGAKRIVVDPITHLKQLTRDGRALREINNSLVGGLKRLGLTSILTCEIPSIFGPMGLADGAVAFVADNILLLKFVEIDSQLKQAIVALKVRGSDHGKDIRQYRIGSKGIEIETKFENAEGLLSGITRKPVTERALLGRGLRRGT